ncbi:MAG: TPM domain-containing protein [Candidatus Omnitrophica bacterium]|nr:TPM domain-containing protein [Candidatus Omnitrophota bacterium]
MKLFPIIFSLFFIALKPIGYLNDFADILSQNQKEEIEKNLREIEKQTGNEIVVLTIKSLEGQNIEEFANEIFNSWGIGKKGKDNGVLIVVAMKERAIRIEVGYGLEKYLSDAVCGRIIRNIIVPNFRKNNYYNGIKESIEIIYKITKGENVNIKEVPDIPPRFFRVYWYFFCILFAFCILGVLGLILESLLILSFNIISLLNKSNNYLYQIFIILLSMIIPFIFLPILNLTSIFIFGRLKRRLKKYYGKKWKNHIPFYLRGTQSFSSTTRGGSFSSGFGGFGGGASGGAGASGRW